MNQKVTVSQANINQGCELTITRQNIAKNGHQADNCPFWRAIKRYIKPSVNHMVESTAVRYAERPRGYIYVDLYDSFVKYDKDGGIIDQIPVARVEHYARIRHPKSVQEWIRDYDAHHDPEPITATLEIPEWALKSKYLWAHDAA